MNKTVWEIYAYLKPQIEIQPAFSGARGQVVTFTNQDILVALPIKDIPDPSFGDVVAQTLAGLSVFREMHTSLTNYDLVQDTSSLGC